MLARHRPRGVLTLVALLVAVLAAAPPGAAQQPADGAQVAREIAGLGWQRGPTEARIGTTATLKVPEGQAFLDAAGTRRFLELNGNPPRDGRYALAAEDLSWFAVFFFEDSGYVKDDEKLDPDALLKALREGDQRSNEERKRLNMPALETVGWHVPPRYDAATKRLEWGMQLWTENRLIVNYTIRLLGRRGVMHAVLVSDPESLDRDIAVFRTTLAGYDFVPGERYAEFRSGDRVAEYGLAALVLGGAAAVATKTGFFKAMGKLVIPGVVALGAAVAAFFRKLRRRA
jgi:uncharacterized membrane-anchored protein